MSIKSRSGLFLAAFVAVAVALAAWPGTTAVQATVNSLATNAVLGEDGDTIRVTVRGTINSGDMTVTTTTGGGNETFSFVSCSPAASCTLADISGNNSNSLVLNTDTVASTYTLVLDMLLDCTSPQAINIRASDEDNTRNTQVFCVPNDNAPQVIIAKDSEANFSYGFTWSASGNCVIFVDGGAALASSGSFDLRDGDEAWFFCASGTLRVREVDNADFDRIRNCNLNTAGVIDIVGSRVDFNIGSISGTVRCTFVNHGFVATATAVVGPVTSVQVLAGNITQCGGSTPVQAFFRNAAGGPAPAGTTVTASSSAGGTFLPAATLTSSSPFSVATFIYQAPPTFNGIATITVRAGSAVGTVNVQVICGVAPTPVPAVPTVVVGPLTPPSAGDGGLIGGGSSGPGFGAYAPSLAAAVAALLFAAAGLNAFRGRAAAVEMATPSTQASPETAPRRGDGALLVSALLVAVALLFRRNR